MHAVRTVGSGDGDTARLLLRRFINLIVCYVLGQAAIGQDAGDGRRQGGLPMVHMPDCADVQVLLGAGVDVIRAETPDCVRDVDVT